MSYVFAASDELSELVHDLRSPLAAIEAAAHAVLDMGVKEPAVRRLIDLMAVEARCAQTLVDSALDGPSHKGTLQIAPVLAAVAARAGTRWSARVHVGGDGLVAAVYGDEADIGRALGNLVDNAFQHGHCREVRVHAVRREQWLVIRVLGSRLVQPRVGHQASHGIGLQSVRRLAQACGGHHEVRLDEGARVDELHLPLVLVPAPSA